MEPEELREQNQLLKEMLEQQKAYIEMQERRIAEKDAAIADLKKLVDELQSLKANLPPWQSSGGSFLAWPAKKQRIQSPLRGQGRTLLKLW